MAGYLVCDPGTVTKGIPIVLPLYVPDPKSGCRGEEDPMVVTQVEELGCTGSWSTRVFQMLSAGNTEQLPTVGACASARLAHPSNTAKMSRGLTMIRFTAQNRA